MSADVSIVTHCRGWDAAVTDAAGLCRRAAGTAWAMAAGDAGGAAAGPEIALVLTDDAEITRLNRRFRSIEGPTDVLSFPTGEAVLAGETVADAAGDDGLPVMLGDIVIALETAAREAYREGKPLGDHLQHLVVHGLLHLLGYDHQGERQAADMESLEVEILSRLGVPDPYAEGPAASRPTRDERTRRA